MAKGSKNQRKKHQVKSNKAKVQATKPVDRVNQSTTQKTQDLSTNASSDNLESSNSVILPENLSLQAHAHILAYIDASDRQTKKLSESEINSILELSQHLRVFGLLSATGYLNHANQQGGEKAKQRLPVWTTLLTQLINPQRNSTALMDNIIIMAQENSAEYMALWRHALLLSQHWNFWAKAYQEEK